MFKKIQLTLLVASLSASSYAYVIQTKLTVENKTDVPMLMTIDQPNGQESLSKPIPAHQTTILDMDNGDHSGLLYQTATAPFKIKSMNADAKVFAQGRVAYYVGASLWNKYSFLDAVSAAHGLKVEPVYSCKNSGYYNNPENKMVIEGTPQADLKITDFPAAVNCIGLKSSELKDDNLNYTATCFDGKSSTFWKRIEAMCLEMTCINVIAYSNHEETYYTGSINFPLTEKVQFDEAIGNRYCANW